VSQLADAIQVIVQRRLEGIMTAKQILMLADRLAEEMLVPSGAITPHASRPDVVVSGSWLRWESPPISLSCATNVRCSTK
jgi:hypothetical protein